MFTLRRAMIGSSARAGPAPASSRRRGAQASPQGQTGALLTVAVAIEYLFVGIAVAAELGAEVPRRRKIGVPFALALLTTLGVGVGAAALEGVPGSVLATVLAFGAVAFLEVAYAVHELVLGILLIILAIPFHGRRAAVRSVRRGVDVC